MTTVGLTKTPRWIERKSTEAPAHFQALDTDVDNIEAAIVLAQQSHDTLTAKLDKMNARLYGVLVALLTASLALAGNLMVHH